MGVPVLLNLGMGVESSAMLVAILEDPTKRDFSLDDLIVITAMTGDEFKETGSLVETHLLPLLRAHRVRFVQLGRAAATVKEAGTPHNYVVLSDTREPAVVFLAGRYKLSQEMLAAGTLPTTAGDRKCSLKAKGEVIDAWIVNELLGGDQSKPFRQMIGFNADEGGRVDKDVAASAERKAKGELTGRAGEFPAHAWGWDRAQCLAVLAARFGVVWPKSCCVYCPFSKGRPEIVERFRRFPDEAALAAWMEFCSLALNHRLKLYESKGVLDVLAKDGNAAALAAFDARVAASEPDWAVYRVRRLYRGVGLADRHIGVLAKGARADMEAATRRLAAEKAVDVVEDGGYVRAWVVTRADPPKRKKGGPKRPYKGVEEMIVAAPRVAIEKSARGWKEETWEARVTLAMAGAAEPVGCGA